MKAVFGIQKNFQSNHLNFKNTTVTVGQAVFRASKLQVFYHARCCFLSGGYKYFPGQSLVRRFHVNMVHATVVTKTAVPLRQIIEQRTLILEKPAMLRTLDCLKSLFVTHAALFLESTSKDVNGIRDWGETLGASGKRDIELEVISCLMTVVRSEKAIFFNC